RSPERARPSARSTRRIARTVWAWAGTPDALARRRSRIPPCRPASSHAALVIEGQLVMAEPLAEVENGGPVVGALDAERLPAVGARGVEVVVGIVRQDRMRKAAFDADAARLADLEH